MADPTFASESIEEMLVAIADGVREAQVALNAAPPVDAYGRQLPLYHLPHLDFEIKVHLETVSVTEGRPIFKITAANNVTDTAELTSVIAGRLTAIPPGEGLPLPQVAITSERLSARRHRVLVRAGNSAGEALAGHTVELNLNLDASRRLSQAAGVNLTSARSTNVTKALLTTDDDGEAETVLQVDPGLPAAAILVLTAELGTAAANLSVTARLLTDAGKDAVGVSVQLQVFQLSTGRWTTLATGKTVSRGQLTMSVRYTGSPGTHAPCLRLVETGSPAPRVLAEGGRMSYDRRSYQLYVDFGVVERLEETAYALTAASSRFTRTTHTVAGQAQRGTVPTAVMIRALSMSNPAVVGKVADAQAVSKKAPAATKAVGLDKPKATSPKPAPASAAPPQLSRAILDAELVKFSSREVALKTDLERQKVETAKTGEQLTAKKSEVRNLELRLAKVEQEKTTLATDNQVMRTQMAKAVPIRDIAAAVGDEIDKAGARLSTTKRAYQIGKINLKLVGTIGDGGTTMALANAADAKGDGPPLHAINLDLHRQSPGDSAPPGVAVPDVTGLTETAVRRLLQAVGLQLEAATRVVDEEDKVAAGQAILQSPKAGNRSPRGAKVLVVFAEKPAPKEEA